MKKTRARIGSLLLALVLVLTLLPVTALAAEPWDGSADTSWYSDTSATEFTIDSAAGLAGLAQLVNDGNNFSGKTIQLTADIDLDGKEWTPIGTSGNPFTGTFDGQDHTISNLTVTETDVNAGLFGLLTSPGKIQKVTVCGATVDAAESAGALVGSAFTGTVENCSAIGTITITGHYKLGGLIGEGYANLIGCTVEADLGSAVTATHDGGSLEGDNVGGLIGFKGEGGNKIENCSVSGLTVTGTRKVGGLVGSAFDNNIIADSTVSDVTIRSNASSDYIAGNPVSVAIGGLVGLYTSNGNYGALTGCTAESVTLTSENSGVQMGYLSGGARGSESVETVPASENWSASGNKLKGSNSGGNASGVVVGEDFYFDLVDAFDAAGDGDTVKLVGDVTLTGPGDHMDNTNQAFIQLTEDADITLDLNGHTLTMNEIAQMDFNKNDGTRAAIEIYDGSLTVRDSAGGGEITGTSRWGGGSIFCVTNDGALTLEDAAVSMRTEVYGDYTGCNNSVVRVQTGGTFEMAGGEIRTTADDTAYSSGGVFNKGGTATLSSGTITTNGNETIAVVSGGSGETTIQGTDIQSEAFGVVLESASSFKMTDGKLEAQTVLSEEFSFNGTAAISGGVIQTEDMDSVKEYIQPGMTVSESGQVVVDSESAVAQIGSVGYDSLQAAVDAVTTAEPTTITLLKNAAGNGVKITADHNITFDLNHFTYTIDGTTVGSSGTETNGFQLLRDSTITFRNGTITSTKAKILIQNYSNLTLDNVTLDGTNLIGSAPYTLSNNFGIIKIKDSTIIAADSGYAFDVYYWPNGGYGDGVSVTVTGDSRIQGNVEYGHDGSNAVNVDEVADKAKLLIQDGTFVGNIVLNAYSGNLKDGDETGITVSGGHFSAPVDADYLHESITAQLKSASNREAPYSYYTSLEAALADAKSGDEVSLVRQGTATVYTVTLNYNDGRTGRVTCEVTKNTSITLPTPTRSGYKFQGWYDGDTKVSSPYQVTDSVTLTARWQLISSDSSDVSGDYIVSVDQVTGGKVVVRPGRADKGDEVTITAIPNDGYVLQSLTVTDKNGDTVRVSDEGNDKYTFTMPGSAVTVKAVFALEGSAVVTPDVSFTDVAESYWAYNEIRWAAENGYMTGTTATTFNPGGTVTRQQVWMILARMAGANPTDMAAAKTWAVNNGISDGTNPGGAVTRQQLVALLYRFAGQYGYNVEGKADLSGYPDVASLASYAAEPMAWSVAGGIIGGTTQGTLNPTGTATRAQFAVILWRFYQTTAV